MTTPDSFFIDTGKFKTGLSQYFDWKPNPNCFSDDDLLFIAEQFSQRFNWFDVCAVQNSAFRFANALQAYSKPSGKYYLVCDNQCYSGLKFRKARNHALAEMDRGKIKHAEVKGAAIFGCGDVIPEWVTDMFRLTIRFREQLYITNKPKV